MPGRRGRPPSPEREDAHAADLEAAQRLGEIPTELVQELTADVAQTARDACESYNSTLSDIRFGPLHELLFWYSTLIDRHFKVGRRIAELEHLPDGGIQASIDAALDAQIPEAARSSIRPRVRILVGAPLIFMKPRQRRRPVSQVDSKRCVLGLSRRGRVVRSGVNYVLDARAADDLPMLLVLMEAYERELGGAGAPGRLWPPSHEPEWYWRAISGITEDPDVRSACMTFARYIEARGYVGWTRDAARIVICRYSGCTSPTFVVNGWGRGATRLYCERHLDMQGSEAAARFRNRRRAGQERKGKQ